MCRATKKLQNRKKNVLRAYFKQVYKLQTIHMCICVNDIVQFNSTIIIIQNNLNFKNPIKW